ncbi:hypothetical protein K2X33_05140 [bacterium]|nr:hypothetical protein [bacterium]MBY0510198.1 hypothetical protein [Rhodospirillaceae bacterium]
MSSNDIDYLRRNSHLRYFPSGVSEDPNARDVSRVKAPPGFINLYRCLQVLVEDEARKQNLRINHLMRLWPFTVKDIPSGLELVQTIRYGKFETKSVKLRTFTGNLKTGPASLIYDAEAVFRAVEKRLQRFVAADKKLLLLKGSRGRDYGVPHIRASFLHTYFSQMTKTGVVFRDNMKIPVSEMKHLPMYLVVFVDERRLRRRMEDQGNRISVAAARNADLQAIVLFLENVQAVLPDKNIRFDEAKELSDEALAGSPNWPAKESRSNGWFRARIWKEFGGGKCNGRRKRLLLREETRRDNALKRAVKGARSLFK